MATPTKAELDGIPVEKIGKFTAIFSTTYDRLRRRGRKNYRRESLEYARHRVTHAK